MSLHLHLMAWIQDFNMTIWFGFECLYFCTTFTRTHLKGCQNCLALRFIEITHLCLTVFPYSQGAQDVAEVTQVDYETCNGRSPLNHWIDGNTHVMLTTPGLKYYICTFPGHCPPVQLAINVVMSSNSTTIPTNQAGTDVNTIAASQRKAPPPPPPSPYYNNNTPSFNSAPALLHFPFLSLHFVPIVWALLFWVSARCN